MPEPSGLLLTSARCTDRGRTAEWTTWLLDEHLPAIAEVEDLGAASADLWSLHGAPAPGGPGPGHSHVVRVTFIADAVAGAAALRRVVDQRRTDGRVHPSHAEIEIAVWSAHRPTVIAPDTDRAASSAGPPRGLLTAEIMCTDPRRQAEWDEWYDDSHVPDMLGTGAFAAARRWRRAVPRGTGCDDLVVYDVADGDLDAAVARSGAAMPALIAAGRKHECHTGGRTMALVREAE